jgi:hypothetical protein
VIDIPEQPKNLHSQRERGRLQAPGHRTDDNSAHTERPAAMGYARLALAKSCAP